jgi:putative toxin-antitoxin system antitoxin component (TIGR02293 family)
MASVVHEVPRSSDVVQILGGREVLENPPSSAEEWHALILEGLPYASLEAVMASYRLTRSEVCETLDLSGRTFSRRKNEERLRPDESDRLYRMARVVAKATEVLGDTEKASLWLRRSNRALGGRSPLYLMRTDLGTRQVERDLGRIEHGIVG